MIEKIDLLKYLFIIIISLIYKIYDIIIMNYRLGSLYPNKENKYLEFKEYCFKLSPSLQFSKKEIFHYLDGNWDINLNNFNNQNIKTYFDYYIPKYLSCFGNSKINGKLIIGIDDDEEITGIPSLNLEITDLQKYLETAIKTYVKCKNQTILDSIKINLIEINDKNMYYLDNELDNILKEYSNSIIKYKEEITEYKKLRKIWEVKIKKYSGKLVMYLNNNILRKEFSDYLTSLNNKKLNKFINLLNSDKYIKYPELTEFLKRKENKDDIFYWVIIFKDLQVEKLAKNKKPKKPKFRCDSDPEKILMKLSYLRYKLYNKLKYYIIELDFNCNDNEDTIYFKYPKNKKWLFRKRVAASDISSGPGCI